MKGRWLNVGSSSVLVSGFEALDKRSFVGVRRCDIRVGLPYPDASVEIICSSHTLEHLHPHTELPGVLKEFHRVLVPGGLVRAAVPDLAVLLRCYADQDFSRIAKMQAGLKASVGVAFSDLPLALQFSAICFGNNGGGPVYDGHYACWDEDALRRVFEQAGFVDVRVVGPTESRHPELLTKWKDIEAAEQIVVETTRP